MSDLAQLKGQRLTLYGDVRRNLVTCHGRTRTKLANASAKLLLEVTSYDAGSLAPAKAADIPHDAADTATPTSGTSPKLAEDPVAPDTPTLQEAKLGVAQANKAHAALSPTSTTAQEAIGVVAEAGTIVEKVKGAIDTWNPLLKRLEQFVDLTGAIAEVRYALTYQIDILK